MNEEKESRQGKEKRHGRKTCIEGAGYSGSLPVVPVPLRFVVAEPEVFKKNDAKLYQILAALTRLVLCLSGTPVRAKPRGTRMKESSGGIVPRRLLEKSQFLLGTIRTGPILDSPWYTCTFSTLFNALFFFSFCTK